MKKHISFLIAMLACLTSTEAAAQQTAANTAVVNIDGQTYSCSLIGQGGGTVPAPGSPVFYPYPSNPLEDQKIKSCWDSCDKTGSFSESATSKFNRCNKTCGVSAGTQERCWTACGKTGSFDESTRGKFERCAGSCGVSYVPDCQARCEKTGSGFESAQTRFEKCNKICNPPSAKPASK